MKATCILNARNLLGEGPVWDDRSQDLYWVDIKKPAIHRLNPSTGQQKTWHMPEPVGCISLRESGNLVAGFKSGFHFVNLDSGARSTIVNPEPDRPGNRFNDGKCDALGRLWAGTMDDSEKEPSGAMYRLNPDLSWHRLDTGYTVFNGPAFSRDGKTVFHTDSALRTVYASRIHSDGSIRDKRPFIQLRESEGYPDGMTVDADDCIWLAHWDGWRITRYSPQGEVVTRLDLPAARITSCAFGGPDLSLLFITSASIGLNERQLAEQPLAGGVFQVETHTRGLPTCRFAG